MVYPKTIEGRYVRLRSAGPQDAQFTLSIRQDEARSRFLHKVENDLGKQLAWLQSQRQRSGDYFFVVERSDGEKIGTVSVYDIHDGRAHFGRLLMLGNPFQTFEAVLLAMDFGFETLGLEELTGDVDEGNDASYRLSEAVGFQFETELNTSEPGRRYFFCLARRAEHEQYAQKIRALIYR